MPNAALGKMKRSKCQEAEQWMTPDQAARYVRALARQEVYRETGDGFGGLYWRDFDKETEMSSTIHEICCEALGEDPYPARSINPEVLRWPSNETASKMFN